MNSNNNEYNKKEALLKKALTNTEIKADENLKHRVMHQIQTEAALSKKEKNTSLYSIGSMFPVFGIMYLLIILAGIGIYFTEGKTALLSPAFYLPIIMIVSTCSIFWFISVKDDERHRKTK